MTSLITVFVWGGCVRRLKILCTVLLLFTLGHLGPAAAQSVETVTKGPSRIASLTAEIVVQRNGDLLVTEEIDLLIVSGGSAGSLRRTFVLARSAFWGGARRVDIEVLDVTRDGERASYVLEKSFDALHLDIRREGAVLEEEGLHRFRITYRTSGELRFLTQIDRLRWSVAGWDSRFPIDRVAIRLSPPQGTPQPVDVTALVGDPRKSGGDVISGSMPDGSLVFVTMQRTWPSAGLNFSVSWPKGAFQAPSLETRLGKAFEDNRGLLVMLVGLSLVWAYYLWQWRRIGRKSLGRGVVVPLFEPPEGLSPAAVGYIWHQSQGRLFDPVKAFAVMVASLAVKGWITVEKRHKHFQLQGRASIDLDEAYAVLPEEEARALEALFPPESGPLIVNQGYAPHAVKMVGKVLSSLEAKCEREYLGFHRGVWSVGWALAGLTYATGVFLQTGQASYVVMLGGFIVAVISAPFASFFSIIKGVFLYRRFLWPEKLMDFFWPLLVIIVSTFLVSEILYIFGWLIGVLFIAVLYLLVSFRRVLRGPTLVGRRLLDGIEGYRLYLAIAEKERLSLLARETASILESVERHQPYAMALDIEQEWTLRFGGVIDSGSLGDKDSQDHQDPDLDDLLAVLLRERGGRRWRF